MADFSFTPAAAGIRPVPQTSLADMIGVARGAQTYQQAQQVNPLQVQQAQAELQRIQGLMPQEIKRAEAEARVSAETATPRITEAQLRAEQAGVDLNQHYANISRGVYGGLLTDPDFVTNNSGAMVKKLENAAKFLKESGVPTHKSSMHDQLTKLAETDPKAAYQMIQNGIQQGGGVASQFAQANAPLQQIATGQGTQFIPTNQYQQTRPGMFVQQQLPPTQQLIAQEGDNTGLPPGTPYLLGPQGMPQMPSTGGGPTTATRMSLVGGGPSQAAPMPLLNAGPTTAAPMPLVGGGAYQPSAASVQPKPYVTGTPPAYVQQAPTMIPAGETQETANIAKQIQLKANESAKNVSQSQANNNQIINLADNALAGFGAQTAANLGGGFALIPWTSDATANRQKLGDFMARETLNLASAGGLGTDAARGITEKITGTTNWTPEAIKSTARINRALSTGTLLFNDGVNNAVTQNNNNPFAARDFQNKWSQIADVNALRLMDLMKNNDTAGMANLIKEFGGPKEAKEKLNTLKLKVSTLNNLIQGGK